MTSKRRDSGAFSLIEVTIGIGIAGFCLLAILGLLPLGVSTNSQSIEETTAVNLLSGIVADIKSTPNPFPKGAAATTPIYQIPIPPVVLLAPPPSMTLGNPDYEDFLSEYGTITPQAQARYRMSVWTIAGDMKSGFVRVILSWPAQASRINASGKVEVLVATNRAQ